jgi:hypothetical protein
VFSVMGNPPGNITCTGMGMGEFFYPRAYTGNPLGNITHASIGMGEFFYPRAYISNLMGKISHSRCGYGVVVPIGIYPWPSLGEL